MPRDVGDAVGRIGRQEGPPNGHAGGTIAAPQMDGGFGAMLRFELTAVKKLVETTKLFQLAVSLWAVELLIKQLASMSHASYDAADRAAFGISDGLIRLSVGLEHVDDLTADLDQAISAACQSAN